VRTTVETKTPQPSATSKGNDGTKRPTSDNRMDIDTPNQSNKGPRASVVSKPNPEDLVRSFMDDMRI